ncbi:MAG: type I methionyl aminopeptidase [Pseudobacteriovorax sp.]|nr:type I methionyl aminopeptidase [Pseudobacteriovorax sp.]
MIVTRQDEIEKLKEIGTIVADCLKLMLGSIEPGMTTLELDAIGKKFLDDHEAQSAPQVCYDFPGATCISLNHEAAHGIPKSNRVIQPGDLINIDVSAEKAGFFGDTGATLAFQSQNPTFKHLCSATKKALQSAMKELRPGANINVIGKAIEKTANKEKLTIIRNLCSHGVGKTLHDEPQQILSYYDPKERRVIQDGLTFTIEPFLSNGSTGVVELDDGWTLSNPKGLYSAQYEHTMIVTKSGVITTTLPSKGAPFLPK